MEKGKGKCTVCGNDEIANGKISLNATADSQEDLEYFENVSIHACTNCGFIQLASKKVCQ